LSGTPQKLEGHEPKTGDITQTHPRCQGGETMSRAFVKEPEGDQLVDELPERVHSPHVNYVTPAGLRQLRQRVDELLARRKLLAGTVPAENKKQLMYIDRDLRYYEERIRRAVLIDPAGQPEDEVHFGAVVDVETPEGRRMTFAVVGEDEADAAQGKISWVSPLAQALAEARVGDAVVWKRPAGEVELTIVAIR
jgi:transcription elongation GreA/GreB family factor